MSMEMTTKGIKKAQPNGEHVSTHPRLSKGLELERPLKSIAVVY